MSAIKETLEEIQRLGRLVEDAPAVEEAAKHVGVMARAVGDIVAAAAASDDPRRAWQQAADAALALDHVVTVIRDRTRG